MSLYEVVSLIIWTASSVAVIYSLYQVNRQTRIFAKQTEYVARSLLENSLESLNRQSRDITRIFLAYPELRPYFYGGKDIDESNPDFHRAETVAELILDIFWTMSTQAERVDISSVPQTDEGGVLWTNFVRDSFQLSPIMVRTLEKRKGWYGQPMVDRMNAILQGSAQSAEGMARSA